MSVGLRVGPSFSVERFDARRFLLVFWWFGLDANMPADAAAWMKASYKASRSVARAAAARRSSMFLDKEKWS